MEEIKSLVWNGGINVRIVVKPNLLLGGVGADESSINLRVPRSIYLPLYLPIIKHHVKSYLRVNLEDKDQHIWFEYEDVPLYWNYPVGILYDSMTSLNPSERKRGDMSSSLYIWTIELAHGRKVPPGVIPIVGGLAQIQSYWMHQWKQACFILNGTAKQMMSLSMQDTKTFWESITTRDRNSFATIAAKIIPKNPRNIPLLIHQSLPEMKITQPVVSITNDGQQQTFKDILSKEFPALFGKGITPLFKVVCCGIDIPLEAKIFETYLRLSDLDGFLHISLGLITEGEIEFKK